MKIVMANPQDIYYVPSATRPVELAAAFTRMGHEVTLLYWPLREVDRKFPRTRVSVPEGVRVVAGVRGGFESWENMRRLISLGRDADIIQFQKCLPPCSIVSVVAAWILGKPVCYDWDDNETSIAREYMPTETFGALVYALERLVPRLCSTITVSSQALRDKAVKLGVPQENIFDAPVGARLDRFDPDERGERIRRQYGIEGPLVLYMGQLQGASYGDLFLRAAEMASKLRPDAYFMVVGGGERLGMLRSAARALGLGARLRFSDYVPHEEVPEYLAAADVVVATFARNETTVCKSPLKIVEYLAAGRPIVASDVGEVRRMVGEGGIVVEPDSADAIARGVSELLADDTLRAELSVLARKRAEDVYNWDATAENMVRAFTRGLEVGRARRRPLALLAKYLDNGLKLHESGSVKE